MMEEHLKLMLAAVAMTTQLAIDIDETVTEERVIELRALEARMMIKLQNMSWAPMVIMSYDLSYAIEHLVDTAKSLIDHY